MGVGAFIGHIVPGLALALLGLWHTINTIRDFCLKGSTKFTVRYWHLFGGPLSRLRYMELIFILSFSVLAILTQLLDFPRVQLSFRLDSFEHATMFLHLAVFAGLTLILDLTHLSNLLSGVIGILAASVFGQELFLLHFHSTDHVGLEGHYHWLLQLIVSVSLMAALVAVIFPTSFPVVLVLFLSVVFQGCWFMTMGFMLWDPDFIPEGCAMRLNQTNNDYKLGAVTCGSREADVKARALANLQFSWVLSGILLSTGFICMKIAGNCTMREQSTEYEQLGSRGSDVTIAIDGLKQAHP